MRNGKTIRQWRLDTQGGQGRLSRQGLATELDVAEVTVRRWETEITEPRLGQLQQMEKVKPGLMQRLIPKKRRGKSAPAAPPV